MPKSTQVSVGYERQLRATMSYGVDYIHNEGRGWIGYDLNPGLRVNTTRTGEVNRTDLLGLASELGFRRSPTSSTFASITPAKPDTMVSTCRWSGVSRASGALASATRWGTLGATTGGALGTNNFQLLAEKNLDMNYGPLDTDRRHNLILSGRMEVPRTGGLTVSSLFRFMTGRPMSIIDTNTDPDRNGILFDPLPAGTYSGDGPNAITVNNEGGRNGAYGPNYLQLDARFGYRLRMGGARTLDLFAEVFNLTDRSNFTNPSGDRRTLATFLVPNGLVAGGFPRQLQIGTRLGF